VTVAENITVFRSRLRDDVPGRRYATRAAELEARAAAFPGFVEFKEFVAADGERLALVTFASDAAEAAWRDDADHRAAQEEGREAFYTDYDVAVCSVLHRRTWRRSGA
jgi:heme-degrading monooxygenase HmoA